MNLAFLGKSENLPARCGIPDARCAVATRGHDATSVRTEHGSFHGTLMSFQERDLGAVQHIPNAGGLVVRRGDNAFAARVESRVGHAGIMAEHSDLAVREQSLI